MNDLMNASSGGLLVEQPLQAFWTTYDPLRPRQRQP